MKELLTYIVENLVSDPAAIAITEEIDGDNITYSLRVAPGDIARTSASQLIFSTEPARIAPKC